MRTLSSTRNNVLTEIQQAIATAQSQHLSPYLVANLVIDAIDKSGHKIISAERVMVRERIANK